MRIAVQIWEEFKMYDALSYELCLKRPEIIREGDKVYAVWMQKH